MTFVVLKDADMNPDITINNHGSVYMWMPNTPKGKEWMTRFFPDAIWHGEAMAMDHRMNDEPLINAILCAGLVVAGDNGIIDPAPLREEIIPDEDEYYDMAERNGYNDYLRSIGEQPSY